MSVSKIGGMVSVATVAGMLLMVVSCGKVPDPVGPRSSGDLELQVQVKNGLGKRTSQLKTNFDSLIIEVEAEDVPAIRFSKPVTAGQALIIDTLSGIPAGAERTIEVRTIDRNGSTVHEDAAGVHTVRIEPNFTTVIQVVLVPVRGSIYLQIAGVPTDIDSMGALFISDGNGEWTTTVARSPKIFLSIDGIPNKTAGVLKVAGFTVEGDTLYRAEAELVVDARSTNSVDLSFNTSPGGVVFEGTLELPGAVAVSGSINDVTVAASEQGDLIITEIMYAANDSEYIEVFNPDDQDHFYDSLYLEIDGTKRLFTDVNVEGKGFYVFGRKTLPWVDAAHSTASALDLSGNGNWITVLTKNLLVLDQVVFTGGTNNLEWPKVSGKRSICLNSSACSAEQNNFGRNWLIATEGIDGAPSQYGTPHQI
ncbi:MAG: hypothetical protein JW863_12205 [Chitinispirillaceae bacterium]|nr:hypothetical protein [Chitinispirillaceae bacterium]